MESHPLSHLNPINFQPYERNQQPEHPLNAGTADPKIAGLLTAAQTTATTLHVVATRSAARLDPTSPNPFCFVSDPKQKKPLDLNILASEEEEQNMADLRNAEFTLEEDEIEEENNQENVLSGGSLLLTVMYRREINPSHVEGAMRAAWSPMWQMTMTALEGNLFLFRFEHRIDLNKALNEGSWRFNKYFVALKEIQKDTPLEKGILTVIPMWIQIHNVPVLKRTEKTAESFEKLFGAVLNIDISHPFLRVLVAFRIRRAIQPHTSL